MPMRANILKGYRPGAMARRASDAKAMSHNTKLLAGIMGLFDRISRDGGEVISEPQHHSELGLQDG
jgi:hypothetical protein